MWALRSHFAGLKNFCAALVLFISIECDRQRSVIIFVSWKFFGMGARTNKGED